jgi:methyltransferase-like protein/2-polyprenyl-3-methyl-5-hydroxy-6-metoxy-1,4-benzoquinol methylase
MSDATHTSYDEIPYKGYSFPQTHPDRLATVARLLGVGAALAESCRVLELGCTDGGNLIPMAASLPHSSFVGIDLSGRQIAAAQKTIQALALENIEVRHLDIADVGEDFGTFDYIICHGVYSWVPAPIQDQILQICARCLSPHGVAYVSYNTYPGWHLRGMIRDMMCYHTKQFSDPSARVQQARILLSFLVKSSAEQTAPYGMLLREELQILNRAPDSYVLHEHLEEVNEPLYFYQFAERATARGLQYLGEADLSAMAPANFPSEVQEVLSMLATDVLHLEQYMDFLRNRTFRQTLLCHGGIRLSRRLRVEDLARFHVASLARPVAEPLDLHSLSPEQFRTPRGLVISVSQPISKAAMLHLSEIWPRYVSVVELLRCARQRLNGRASSQAASEAEDLQILGRFLVSAYTAASRPGIVDLRSSPPRFTSNVSERPIASPLSRYQAESGNRVTNLRHEPVTLPELERRLLLNLDGTRGRPELLEMLLGLVHRGELQVEQQGQRVEPKARVQELLANAVDRGLTQLVGLALLVE